MERRTFIKAGIFSALGLLFTSTTGSSVFAADVPQSMGANSVGGSVTYNAGWVINLEDRAGLLELEDAKNKALEAKKGVQNSSPADIEQKPAKKTVFERAQDWLNKAKGWF